MATSEQSALEPEAARNTLPSLTVFNTLSRKKELFTPLNPPRVSIYVCGVTAYDYSHLGHARAFVGFDVLTRVLTQLGYDVLYIRNYTDVGDKIIDRAKEEGTTSEDIAKKYMQAFREDLTFLGCMPPSLEPRATDYIPQMIQMIEEIISYGHAYVVDQDVYFDTSSVDDYGSLSNQSVEEHLAGTRVAVDERKRHPADFALWKGAKAGEPFWKSPWGPGRPGWHIECSAMIRDIAGHTIDIHGGGNDLVFPHHENERIQSQAAVSPCKRDLLINGTDFVRYWMHNGFVTIDNVKMSKSLANFITIRDVLQKYHPMAMRWMLISSQYKQPLNYSRQLIEEAEGNVYYVCQTLLDAFNVTKWQPTSEESHSIRERYAQSEVVRKVLEKLCDDVNTPMALADVYGHLKEMNELMHSKKGRKDRNRDQKLKDGCRDVICCMQRLLGIDVSQPEIVLKETKEKVLQRAGMTEEDVAEFLDARAEARSAKDYDRADALREELSQKGIAICDSSQGSTTWRPA